MIQKNVDYPGERDVDSTIIGSHLWSVSGAGS